MTDLVICPYISSFFVNILAIVAEIDSKLMDLNASKTTSFSAKNIETLIWETDLVLESLDLTNPIILLDLQS